MARDPRFDILFTPLKNRPEDDTQSFLSGAALQRFGHELARHEHGKSRHQGRGRMGCRKYRAVLDPP